MKTHEIFTYPKYINRNTRCILYINGSRPLLNDQGKLNKFRRTLEISKTLSQFGDHLIYGNVYWRVGPVVFNNMEKIIKENNIIGIVGNSAGGYISFHLSNKYKIPAMSINPAMATTSEAPKLQPIPQDMINLDIYPKQLVLVGENDRKANGGVDMDLVVEDLRYMNFEEKGAEFMFFPNTYHKLSPEQLNKAFKYFYEKFL